MHDGSASFAAGQAAREVETSPPSERGGTPRSKDEPRVIRRPAVGHPEVSGELSRRRLRRLRETGPEGGDAVGRNASVRRQRHPGVEADRRAARIVAPRRGSRRIAAPGASLPQHDRDRGLHALAVAVSDSGLTVGPQPGGLLGRLEAVVPRLRGPLTGAKTGAATSVRLVVGGPQGGAQRQQEGRQKGERGASRTRHSTSRPANAADRA
jgi:hypothetical protein